MLVIRKSTNTMEPVILSNLEGSTIRYADGKVCDHSKDLVRENTLECQIVSNFVDGQEQVVIECSTDGVCAKDKPPRKWIRSSKAYGGG